MLWLGLAALLVGLISLSPWPFSLVVDWSWQLQCVAFAAFALASIPLWRRLAKQVDRPTDQPFLNRRAEALVGRMFTLEKPIISGVGAISVDDTVWRVRGRCPRGQSGKGDPRRWRDHLCRARHGMSANASRGRRSATCVSSAQFRAVGVGGTGVTTKVSQTIKTVRSI